MLTSDINRIAQKVADIVIEKTDTIMNSKQCAKYLGTTEEAVRKMCCRDQIPFHKKHSRYYFFKNEINEYFKNS